MVRFECDFGLKKFLSSLTSIVRSYDADSMWQKKLKNKPKNSSAKKIESLKTQTDHKKKITNNTAQLTELW